MEVTGKMVLGVLDAFSSTEVRCYSCNCGKPIKISILNYCSCCSRLGKLCEILLLFGVDLEKLAERLPNKQDGKGWGGDGKIVVVRRQDGSVTLGTADNPEGYNFCAFSGDDLRAAISALLP